MSEGSIPPPHPGALRLVPSALRRRLAGLLARLRRREPAPELRARAASALARYARTNADLLDRAARLAARAERLEREGTPSESVRNRAERARREIEAGLAALRDSFAASGREALEAFELELERVDPALRAYRGGSRP
ncbi:hypothetical protein Rxyl_2430 [Rubrobacter xylanophilus DSM 9941]|uniref:Uncharacterized protein n=1 Tax=Rubrobacter xylanophilus (strain DSM 9941 / JCM 11954 / NBRC 16129 / PRD-1) TaxID=266117 RepID=Q1ATC1_RUBXD|nr:hypothetical protein [Rubrobacter xylanophilus]ABG05357.1 hypothetical protein Rxyl_2430 [Rubrobacter xylanophilus DSM 9941]